jgi:hypothetical protein
LFRPRPGGVSAFRCGADIPLPGRKRLQMTQSGRGRSVRGFAG